MGWTTGSTGAGGDWLRSKGGGERGERLPSCPGVVARGPAGFASGVVFEGTLGAFPLGLGVLNRKFRRDPWGAGWSCIAGDERGF